MTRVKQFMKNRSMKRVKIAGTVLFASALVAGTGYTHYQMQQYDTQLQQAVAGKEAATEDFHVEQEKVVNLTNANDSLNSENEKLKEKVEKLRREVKRGNSGMSFTITAYDLSVESCGKGKGHPGYGITATGTNLAGHSLESARAISVDPHIIPLGSKVRISFEDEEMKRYDGIYTAVDTGGAIIGNHIDLFAGEGAHNLAMHIGTRQAKVTVL